jgi:hypothetical protein
MLLTRQQLHDAKAAVLGDIEAQQRIQKGYHITLSPGQTVVDLSPTPVSENSGTPPELGDAMSAMKGGNQPGDANAQPPKPRVIATGGAPLPTDDFGKYFLPAAAKARGKKLEDLTPEELGEIRSEFTGEGRNPTEASLAWRSINGKTKGERDLAEAALKRLDQSKIASRPNYQFTMPSNLPPGPMTLDQVPEAYRDQVKQVTEYRKALPPQSQRNPINQAINFYVAKLDPTYDATQFPARNKTALAYSPGGAEGQALKAADTALSHLKTISEAGEALQNGDVQVVNRIANSIGAQIGKSPANTYDTIVRMVAPEISKAVIGAAGGEAERQSMQQGFASSLSQPQRNGAIGAAAGLLAKRVEKSARAYEQQMGKPLAWKLSPESQAVLDKFAAGSGGGGPLPQGGGKAADATVIKQFLDSVGGDKDKARKALTDNGWTIPAK